MNRLDVGEGIPTFRAQPAGRQPFGVREAAARHRATVAPSAHKGTTNSRLAAPSGVRFDVGHDADARAIAELSGAVVNPNPTGFVVGRDGRASGGVPCSGWTGRLIHANMRGLVRDVRGHGAAA